MELTPYLMFNGNCEEALNFYSQAFNGQIKSLQRFGDVPGEPMGADKQKVIHANFEANGVEFMASDGSEDEESGGNVHLSVNFDNVDEEEKVFNGLTEGGKITMPLQDTFWGARFGMLTDKYGIKWMVNCEVKK